MICAWITIGLLIKFIFNIAVNKGGGSISELTDKKLAYFKKFE